MSRKFLSLLLCVLMCLACLAACTNEPANEPNDEQQEQNNEEQNQENQQPEEPTYKDTIVYSMDSAPSGNYVPVHGLSDYDGVIAELVYASMLTPDPEGNLQPYLAESYEVSEDGLVYTFNLHENAVWSDGEKLTADDVYFTFTLLADPDNEDFYGEDIKRVKGVEEYRAGADTIEGVKVIDENTVEITLVEYYAKGLSFMGEMGIMPEHIWTGIKFLDLDSQGDMVLYPVGSGPYLVTNFVNDEYVELVANPDFFLGEPLTKNLYLKVVNADSVTAELTAGTVDIAAVTNLTSSEIEELDAGNLDIATFYYDLFQVMRFSPQRPMEEHLRKAMAYAIDRQSMVDTLMEGRGVISNMIISAGSWGYPSDVEGWTVDLEKAKQFLADGGYVDVNGDGFVEDPEGNEMILEMVYPSGLVVREQSAVVIQENLKQIGVNVALNMMDFPTLMGYFGSGEYDLMLMGHGLDSVDPDPSSFMNLGFSDEAKALCAQAASSLDKEERVELYAQIAEHLKADANVITLYCQEKAHAYNDKLINYEPGTFNAFYKVHLWAIAE